MTAEKFNLFKSGLPELPGVYRYYNAENELLYVGKAKDLRKRVSSYFNKTLESLRINVLVRHIHRIEFTVVQTEQDAFLLENNLIKELQPRFNILLKDDKTFPYICIKNEPFPRIFLTRKKENDGSEYLGPYTSVFSVKNILALLFSIFPIRTCQLNLKESNIRDGKFKVCLEYHIKRCLGPCEGLQSEQEYLEGIRQIRHILKSEFSAVLSYLHKKMEEYSEAMEFEKAMEFKTKIDLVTGYQSKSTVVNPRLNNLEVFGFCEDKGYAYLCYFKVVNGSIIATRNFTIQKILDESSSEILETVVGQVLSDHELQKHEVLLPFAIDTETTHINFQVPVIGDKKKLVDMANTNAAIAMQNALNARLALSGKSPSQRILEQLMNDLHLKKLPLHIECFDNSNLMGTHAVSAMVLFRNAKPSKKEYRHFNVKTVTGPDDFSTMKEVITRRYTRLLEEKQSLPDLIIVDGGKGQLSSAIEALKELQLDSVIPIVGIAKRLEEIYHPGDSIPLHINKKSESLKLIQRMRDEAHRFGITHHRNRRSKTQLSGELEQIEGIGEKTIELLMNQYKSVKKIRQVPLDELAGLIGAKKAKLLFDYFQNANL